MNWRKLFGTGRPSLSADPEEFRTFALQTLADRFHGANFSAAKAPLVVCFGVHEFGLQSVLATYLRDKLTEQQLRELLILRFERLLAAIGFKDDPAPPLWSVAESQLRPQIMPIEYIEQAPAPLLFWPLNDDTCIGTVLDQANTYSYVREMDPSIWGQNADAVLNRAVRNLDEASRGIDIHVYDEPERFVAIEAADGYDAARILIPNLRQHISKQLGSPFLAGIPNRDFLICWSTDCSQHFHQFTRDKIAKDFETQPYPLTAQVFVATPAAIQPEAAV